MKIRNHDVKTRKTWTTKYYIKNEQKQVQQLSFKLYLQLVFKLHYNDGSWSLISDVVQTSLFHHVLSTGTCI